MRAVKILPVAVAGALFAACGTSATSIRAAYGPGASKSWEQAQDQCSEWGGSLLKAEVWRARRAPSAQRIP
jgi:hypothetical protein